MPSVNLGTCRGSEFIRMNLGLDWVGWVFTGWGRLYASFVVWGCLMVRIDSSFSCDLELVEDGCVNC